MNHLWKLVLAAAVLAGGVFAALRFAPAGGPLAGNWKVTVLRPGVEDTVCLLRVGGNEASPTAEVLDAPGLTGAEAEVVRFEGGALRFGLKTDAASLQVAAYVPKGEAAPARLLGSVRVRGSYEMLRLERTDLKELDPKKLRVQSPGFLTLNRAMEAADLREKEDGVREVLRKYGDQPVARFALLTLLQLRASAGAPADELKTTAERYLAASAPYGREIELQAVAQLARGLARLPAARGGALAADYARRADKLLTRDDPPALAVGVLKTLAQALQSAGKGDEAKEVAGRIDELEARLDAESTKNAVPFHPAAPAGRRAGDRVVLAELFTGAQCPPCVAADVAFDAALQVYEPGRAVFLQYHEHIPGPDPLTCPAGEERLQFYNVSGTPTFVIDGRTLDEPVGGPADRGEASYGLLHAALDRAAESPPWARLKLRAGREGDVIELTAEVSELTRPSERTRLRFVLAEDVVRYPAPNGQRLHHHVVRDFPGGAAGFPLPEKTARKSVKVDLGQVRKQLRDYLARAGRGQPFPEDEQPLELRHLKAVAFVQDDATKEVLQAAQADVPEGK